MEGGVQPVLEQTYRQEPRDSHLTPPQFCPTDWVHLRPYTGPGHLRGTHLDRGRWGIQVCYPRTSAKGASRCY